MSMNWLEGVTTTRWSWPDATSNPARPCAGPGYRRTGHNDPGRTR